MASTVVRIGPADRGRKMTPEEFREAREEPGYLYELARGVLEVTEVPNDPHRQVVDNLHEAFSLHRRQQPGLILCIGHGSEIRLQIPELDSDRHPDLGVVLRGTPPDGRGRRQPSLVVEVVSRGDKARRRDYEAKREEYLSFGIREYWIVDPDLRQVAVLVRRGEAQGPAWEEHLFRGDDVVGSELLPGFVGTVAEFWVDAEFGDVLPGGGEGDEAGG